MQSKRHSSLPLALSNRVQLRKPPLHNLNPVGSFNPAKDNIIVSDDKSQRGVPDSKRMDVNDPNELRHWSKSLGVTPDSTRTANGQLEIR
jgi:hypothetical protein